MKAVAELVEVAVQQRMLDGLLAGVPLQVSLGSVHEDVVPGLVLRGATSCHFLVPIFRELEGLVHTDDNSAVLEELVANDLTGMELVAELNHQSSP